MKLEQQGQRRHRRDQHDRPPADGQTAHALEEDDRQERYERDVRQSLLDDHHSRVGREERGGENAHLRPEERRPDPVREKHAGQRDEAEHGDGPGGIGEKRRRERRADREYRSPSTVRAPLRPGRSAGTAGRRSTGDVLVARRILLERRRVAVRSRRYAARRRMDVAGTLHARDSTRGGVADVTLGKMRRGGLHDHRRTARDQAGRAARSPSPRPGRTRSWRPGTACSSSRTRASGAGSATTSTRRSARASVRRKRSGRRPR